MKKIENISSLFRSVGYSTDIIKQTIDKTIIKLTSPTKQGPKKCPVYFPI